jgi:hypothetical protein
LAEDLGINRILVASDCKVVVSEIVEGARGKNGAIIEEIKARVKQHQEFNLVFVSRMKNF